ncbi:hypothetical protein JL475_23590 [Streptomyces sp. M2CJ-2]|uniref:hypothetical protein n=1 Tax=Streptomyces sp. M2CJ-2 TaxID=2803948 RepID=UPI00192826B5|nr:hypothetical protein [Streptomyces sp. M2CJ-2]MBL3668921.1 hypothetical protein [Streptomyces sp. M2CJ-2]
MSMLSASVRGHTPGRGLVPVAARGEPDLESRLLHRIDQVEEALRECVGATDPCVSELAGHLMAAGGKRLRPLLALSAGTAGARRDL